VSDTFLDGFRKVAMSDKRWAVGVDFGGTNLKVGLVNAAGRVRAAAVLPVGRPCGPAEFLDAVEAAAGALMRRARLPAGSLRGVGVGAPGPVDARRGIVRTLVNVAGWREVPLARRLERRLGCRARVENDANLVALGEWRYGAGRGSRQLVCLTLGTGVGGGLILEGRLQRGASGAAGEIGHVVVDPGGPRCGCGRRGCLEAHVGTAAILRLARRALRNGRGPLRRLAVQACGELSPALVSKAAAAGDAGARRVWEEIGRWLGLGLAGVANLLNPDRIVIGGGVAGGWRFFEPAMRRALAAHALPAAARSARVVRGELGNRAGIVGAAVLLWRENQKA
jgi:glucokinase